MDSAVNDEEMQALVAPENARNGHGGGGATAAAATITGALSLSDENAPAANTTVATTVAQQQPSLQERPSVMMDSPTTTRIMSTSSPILQQPKNVTAVAPPPSAPPPPPLEDPKLLSIVRSELATIVERSRDSLKQQQPPPPTANKASSSLTSGSSFRRSPANSRPSSKPGSRASSPSSRTTASEASEELPTNVSTSEQLAFLPAECLSRMPDRPLQHLDEFGNSTTYALNPMMFSVIFILLIELLERFAFYGINYTQTSFLTGAYDTNWNAGMEAVSASTYVSISVAVAYTTPFIGAILADSMIGDYWALLCGTLIFYLPGLLLIALTTIPGVLGDDFNTSALSTGLLFLWPVGTGIVKSVVNVFGARQFHPLLQSSLIESYYVNFYMSINIGALVGGVVVPLMCQLNITIAYFLPVVMLALGVSIFLLGTKRYVCNVPKTDVFTKTGRVEADSFNLRTVLAVSVLVIPFNIAYSQMSTTFIVQGTVMKKAFGFIDAACMNNADALAVLLFGSYVGSHLYPWLANRGIKIPTTYKFAVGSVFGVLSIAWALLVEHKIHSTYAATGKRINILWQAMSYILIGAGEIFAVSAAYEAAFSVSPPEKKVLASAVNLFCVGGLPNVICIMLYHLCAPWFRNSRGTTNITHIRDYASANVGKYFAVLLVISLVGVIINLLPITKNFVADIEEKSAVLIRTPKTPVRPPRRERKEAEEESPLIRAQRHQAYLKYGSAPVLNRSGSMRAGSSLAHKTKAEKKIKKRMLRSLYDRTSKPPTRSEASPAVTRHLLIPPASAQLAHRSYSFPDEPNVPRSNSN